MLRPYVTAIALLLWLLVRAAHAADKPETLLERAHKAVAEAKAATDAAAKTHARDVARKLYRQAYELYGSAEAEAEKRLKQFPAFIEPTETAQIEARDIARTESIQAQLFTAAALFESARAYDRGSPEAKQILQEAADKFGEIYSRFRNRLAGHMARVKQGQCCQELGDTRSALGYYAAILQQPDDIAPLRPLKATAMRLSLECWTGSQENRQELAFQEGEAFLVNTQKVEARQPDFLAIYYYTALGYQRYREKLRPEEAALQGEMLVRATQYAEQAAAHPGEFQDAAKQLAAALRAAQAQ